MKTDFKNIKKSTFITIFVIIISVSLLVIVSSLIYNSFFKSDINKEKNTKQAQEYMDKTLKSNSKKAADSQKQNEKIIKKHSLNIFGNYECTFNESEEVDPNDENSVSYTQQVTYNMEIKDDSTAVFSDGTKGWWTLKEDENGIVHMGLVIQDKKDPEIYLICDDALVDETKALFIGKIPEGNLFDAEFSSGGLTLSFKSNGKVSGEFTETDVVGENGKKYPRTEAYGGNYKRDGNYLNITLNGSDALYYIFKTSAKNQDKAITGFASRYYIKK